MNKVQDRKKNILKKEKTKSKKYEVLEVFYFFPICNVSFFPVSEKGQKLLTFWTETVLTNQENPAKILYMFKCINK